MKSGKILLGVFGGLVAGALLGILLAPDKGSNTRKKIMRKGEDLVDNAKDRLDEMVEGVNSKIQNLVQEATNLAKRGKEKTNSVKEEMMM
ncbi:MAG: YtxH domain-containing protein [Thermoanaerobaculia bacterium]|nr:YtxH domain-containing protein [Thermoanaerobaculia bacterium]